MTVARKLVAVGSATLVSRVLGFVRDEGVAALLGAGPLADAYIAAIQIPNLFRRLLADGALNSAFVPMWLRIRNDAGADGARRFGGQAMGAMLAGLTALALLCIFFAPAMVSLSAPGFQSNGDRFAIAVLLLRLAVPYIAIAGLVAVAAAILNAEGRVGAAAGGTIAFNCVLVATLAVVAVATDDATRAAALVLAISFIVAGAVQLIFVGAALIRLKLHPDTLALADTPDMRNLYARALPGAVAAGMPQFVLMAGTVIASPAPAAVSWLYYANRLYELPLGVISIAVAAVLAPRIATAILAHDRSAIAVSQSRAFEVTLAIALPATIGFVILSTPITRFLFEHGVFGADDTAAVAAALGAIAAGLAGHALEKVLGAISFARNDARTPMLTALAGLAVSATAAALLFPRFGHVGIAAAMAVSGWVGALLLMTMAWQRGWIIVESATRRRLAGIFASALAMGCVVALVMTVTAAEFGTPTSFAGQFIWLSLLIGVGICTYLLSLWQLGIADIRKLIAAARTQS